MGLNMSTSYHLTSEDKEILTKQWNDILKGDRNFGCMLFIQYLEAHPEDKHYFKFFVDKPLNKDPILKLHAFRIVKRIGLLIEAIHRPESVKKILNEVAKIHKKMNITMKSYLNLKLTLVDTLTVKYKFASREIQAWEIATTEVIDYIRFINIEN